MNIILAAPNTASTSLTNVINKHTDHLCCQVFHYPNTSTILRKRGMRYVLKKFKIKGLLKIITQYYFLHLIDKHLSINSLTITNPAKDFESISNYHSDICDFDSKLYRAFHSNVFHQEKMILKQHFPPTDKNVKFFKNFKKIILVRETDSILNKYKNTDKLYGTVNEDKLRLEIDAWKNKWMLEEDALIINFEELVNNPYEQLKSIEEYTGIKFNISEKFKLPHLNKTKK